MTKIGDINAPNPPRRSVGPWILASWVIPIVAFLAAHVVATSGPNAEFVAQQRAERAAERKQLLEEEREHLLGAETQEKAFPRYRRIIRDVRAAALRAYPELDWSADDLFDYSVRDTYCRMWEEFRPRSFDREWEVDVPFEVAEDIGFDEYEFANSFKRIIRTVGKKYGFDGRVADSDEDYLGLQNSEDAVLGVRLPGRGEATVSLRSNCLLSERFQVRLREQR